MLLIWAAGEREREKEWNPESAATASGLREAPSVALIEKRAPSMKSKQGCTYVIPQRLFTQAWESARGSCSRWRNLDISGAEMAAGDAGRLLCRAAQKRHYERDRK